MIVLAIIALNKYAYENIYKSLRLLSASIFLHNFLLNSNLYTFLWSVWIFHGE